MARPRATSCFAVAASSTCFRNVRGLARDLGCALAAPLGMLSLLALSVIPDLRITDQGLIDVVNQTFIPVSA